MNHRFMPAREEAKPIKILHDLNVLSSEDIGFKYKGKVYKLGKLTVAAWMQLIPAYAKVQELQNKLLKGEEVDVSSVIEGYFEITSTLIPELTYAEIRAMEYGELNAILNLIKRKFEGDPTLGEEAQKKNPQTPIVKKSLLSRCFHSLRSYVNTMDGATKKS